jgi:hypothetical protein
MTKPEKRERRRKIIAAFTPDDTPAWPPQRFTVSSS